jgi:hypothetical protein
MLRQRSGVTRVRRHPLDAVRVITRPAPGPSDDADAIAALGEQPGGGGSDRSGSDDDLQRHRLHPS